jgi:tetratricopeptide (TPR) repeat protein
VHLKLGNTHYRRGALDEAHAAWEQALALDPDNRIVKANLSALPKQHVAETNAVERPDAPSPDGELHDDDPIEIFVVDTHDGSAALSARDARRVTRA